VLAEGLLLGQPVGVAAKVALQMRPAHLPPVGIEMAVAVPAVRDHDPVIGADECVELLGGRNHDRNRTTIRFPALPSDRLIHQH